MRVRPARRLITCALLAAASFGYVDAALAAATCNSRLADQILVVNVRPAGCTTNEARLAERLRVKEYAVVDESGARRWMDSDFWTLIEPTAPGVVTVFFVHGNKVDTCMARSRGLRVYRSMARRLGNDRAVRFVIFSWPSTEIPGLLKDFRVKAARTRPVGWELAWVVNQMPVEEQISFLGYSYGARIVGGAMHLLAGGDLNGLGLYDQPTGHRPPMRVAFLAAATHAHWFGPNCYHGLAMNQIEELMLLNNRNDPAMRYYRLIDKCSNPQAMGYCGPTCLSAEARSRVTNYDCSRCVGRSHDLFRYLATGRTMTRVWEHLTYIER